MTQSHRCVKFGNKICLNYQRVQKYLISSNTVNVLYTFQKVKRNIFYGKFVFLSRTQTVHEFRIKYFESGIQSPLEICVLTLRNDSCSK